MGLGLLVAATSASCGSTNPSSAGQGHAPGAHRPATGRPGIGQHGSPAGTDLPLALSGPGRPGTQAPSTTNGPPGASGPGSSAATADLGQARCPQLTTAQLVGQRFIFSFRGTAPPADLVRRIELGQAAGVILFSSNFTSTAGLRQLTGMLQALPRPAALHSPLLIMTDQEGGEVTRIPEPLLRSASATARVGTSQEAFQLGEQAGATLVGGGVNMDLAPVLDVARPGSFLATQQRTYGSSAQAVGRLGESFATGLARAGVIATPKHFPGLGSAVVSTDDAPVHIGLARATLAGVDEAPFASAISAGAPSVMLATAVYPTLDPSLPAALSPVVATDELRGRLGFRGVSISDDLDAPALSAYGAPGQRALLAALAGTDLLLFASSYSSGAQAQDYLIQLAGAGHLPNGGMCASAGRILTLRAQIPMP